MIVLHEHFHLLWAHALHAELLHQLHLKRSSLILCDFYIPVGPEEGMGIARALRGGRTG